MRMMHRDAEQTARSSKLLEQFDGCDTGDVISILATALQMAICYGAEPSRTLRTCSIVLWSMPRMTCLRQYDLVQGMREMIDKMTPRHKGH